jgi:hypothetical protein
MYYNFEQDLAMADKVEVEVIKRLQKVNSEFIFNGFSGTKGYDATFTIANKVYLLEIKSDYYTENTGNVVIEYESRGKASGIATTKAHFWAYAVMRTLEDFDIYLINANKLKELIDNEVYYDKIIGGDPLSNTKMYKFKLEDFKKYCKKV